MNNSPQLPLDLSSPTKKLIIAATDIMSTEANDFFKHISFSHAVFCQVGLPRSKVNGQEFVRSNGGAWLNIQAGYLDEGNGPVLQFVPYGAIPRLTLAHLSTFAVRYKTREIPMKDSAAQFLKELGAGSNGYSYRILRKQMHALAACRLQLGYKGRTFNGQPVEQFDAWLNNSDTEQRSLWPGTLVLSETFYDSLIAAPVPIDIRALTALKKSALALDIYVWLAHRLFRVENSKGVHLHWSSIRKQFAQEYTGKEADKNFKKAFLPQLRKVMAVYPKAKVEVKEGGLLLQRSEPPIPLIDS